MKPDRSELPGALSGPDHSVERMLVGAQKGN